MRSLLVMFISIVLALTLASCADAEATESRIYSQTYSAKLYSGGDVVEEWHGISNYNRWSSQYITLYIDGKQVSVMGGPLVIRDES